MTSLSPLLSSPSSLSPLLIIILLFLLHTRFLLNHFRLLFSTSTQVAHGRSCCVFSDCSLSLCTSNTPSSIQESLSPDTHLIPIQHSHNISHAFLHLPRHPFCGCCHRSGKTTSVAAFFLARESCHPSHCLHLRSNHQPASVILQSGTRPIRS